MATHRYPGPKVKDHKQGSVAAGEVQGLPAYSHQLGLGLICGSAIQNSVQPLCVQAPMVRHDVSSDVRFSHSDSAMTFEIER